MITMELIAELHRELSTITNESVMQRVIDAIKAIKQEKDVTTPPCCYTTAEVKARLALTREDAIAGRGISGEEVNRTIKKMLR